MKRTVLWQNTPLFKVTGDKVFFLDDVQVAKVMDIYKQMQEENQSDYINKSDVLRCYLHLLVHTALKMQDSNQYESHPNASQRITELFIELLDRQFPVDYPNRDFKSAHSCRLRKPPVCTR